MFNENDLFEKITGKKRKLSEMNGEAEMAEPLRFAELFAGIGGGRVALEWGLGLKHVFSSEIDENAREFYKLNFGEKPQGDIKKISSDKILDFDFLVAGFPCQPFSLSGNQKGFQDKKNGNIFFQITRILKEKQPALFLLENVEQLEKNKNGCLEIIMKALDEAGYDTKTAVLNSCNFGTPQHRVRWYCVGIRKDLDPKKTFEQYFQFPEQMGAMDVQEPMLLDIIEDTALPLTKQLEYHPETLKQAIPHLVNQTKTNFQEMIQSYEANPTTQKLQRFDTALRTAVKIPAEFFKSGKLADNGMMARFTDSGAFRPVKVTKGKKENVQGSFATYNARSLTTHAATLTAKGHGNNILELGRCLSAREQARLQTFPERYEIVGNLSKTVIDRCFGNAFTVNVIQAIAQNMIEHYNKIKAQVSFQGNLPAKAQKQKYSYKGRNDKTQGFKQMAAILDTFDLLEQQQRSIKRLRTLGTEMETAPDHFELELGSPDLSDSEFSGTLPESLQFKMPNFFEKPSAFKAVLPKKQIRSIKKKYTKMMEHHKNHIASGKKQASGKSHGSNNASQSSHSHSAMAMDTKPDGLPNVDSAKLPYAGKRITFKFDHGSISFQNGAVVDNTLRDLGPKRARIVVLEDETLVDNLVDSLKGSAKVRV